MSSSFSSGGLLSALLQSAHTAIFDRIAELAKKNPGINDIPRQRHAESKFLINDDVDAALRHGVDVWMEDVRQKAQSEVADAERRIEADSPLGHFSLHSKIEDLPYPPPSAVSAVAALLLLNPADQKIHESLAKAIRTEAYVLAMYREEKQDLTKKPRWKGDIKPIEWDAVGMTGSLGFMARNDVNSADADERDKRQQTLEDYVATLKDKALRKRLSAFAKRVLSSSMGIGQTTALGPIGLSRPNAP
jgi:hypothetical protein